ncbi:hypothetical protein ACFSHQ_17215 [Gemmobacter lanyuensis]
MAGSNRGRGRFGPSGATPGQADLVRKAVFVINGRSEAAPSALPVLAPAAPEVVVEAAPAAAAPAAVAAEAPAMNPAVAGQAVSALTALPRLMLGN